MIEIPCVAKCDRCETKALMVIASSGEVSVRTRGDEAAAVIVADRVDLPDGWSVHHEPDYYGTRVAEVLCYGCTEEQRKKRGW